jgi:hypothetical protein
MPIRTLRWVFWCSAAAVRANRLRSVYLSQKSRTTGARIETSRTVGLERCDIRYINLDYRKDRRAEFESEMRRLGVSWHERITGIPATPGMLGCALSHVDLLNSWDRNPGRLLLVCEDDVEFIASRNDIDFAIEEFCQSPELEVLMLAHNAAWHIPISDQIAISSDILTTSAFILRPTIAAAIQMQFQKSVEMLQAGNNSRQYALDFVWRDLQATRLFGLVLPRLAKQRDGYSDIEGRETSYGV